MNTAPRIYSAKNGYPLPPTNFRLRGKHKRWIARETPLFAEERLFVQQKTACRCSEKKCRIPSTCVSLKWKGLEKPPRKSTICGGHNSRHQAVSKSAIALRFWAKTNLTDGASQPWPSCNHCNHRNHGDHDNHCNRGANQNSWIRHAFYNSVR